ncbi:DUF2339 domain-containing protein [Apibacter sp. HY039]|uniref:DUF2339 domain-containing protein n=1 Tax=Apibacter sp. HY039 TaxID=2501476 RepID=UPI000FEC0BCE|nr:DUF2339 domain-containing protein [Apibacter sp. HY039]
MLEILLILIIILLIIILLKLSFSNTQVINKFESLTDKFEKLEDNLNKILSNTPVEDIEIKNKDNNQESMDGLKSDFHFDTASEIKSFEPEKSEILNTDLADDKMPEIINQTIEQEIQHSNSELEGSVFYDINKDVVDNSKEETSKKTFEFEKLFGENILSKVGITTLVLGIAYFVKYAIDQNWIGESGRVAIGMIVGIGIIGIAHKLRKKYLAFSALLAGGGISVFYITLTIAYREYMLFTQPTAFCLLIVVTLISVGLSLFYNERILAIFSLLGGFASPLLVSTESGNYITLFSYIFILNSGMLILAYKKKWKIVSILSYVLTFVFYSFWLITSFRSENREGATVFSVLFFVQFYTLALIEFYKNIKFSPYQIVIVLSNNFILYLSLIYIYDLYPRDVKGLITMLMAVINVIPVFILLITKQKQSLFFQLLLGIVLAFITLAIPIQLKGTVITMFWGVESVIVFWLYKNTGINIFKKSFYLLIGLSMLSLLKDYVNGYISDIFLNGIVNLDHFSIEYKTITISPIFITALFIILCLLIIKYMIKNCESVELNSQTLKIFGISNIKEWIINSIWFLGFIFPLSELTSQLYERYYAFPQIALLQGVYIYTYAAIYYFINRKKISKLSYIVLGGLVILYSVVYLLKVVSNSTDMIFYSPKFRLTLHLIHYLTIPLFIYLVKLFCNKNTNQNNEIPYWIVAVSSLIALSVEIDNTVLLKYSHTVLFDIHTIVYPIIWGISGLILIILGMKKNKVILRKISLALFGLIILKLYLYDIWQMSQTGKIISFILLGIILLCTSFLYQKLKILVKNEDESKSEETDLK